MALATREVASDSITSGRFALESFCQAAISSSSIISLYQARRLESFAVVCRVLFGSTWLSSVLICWRAAVGESGAGPTTLNCAFAATLDARSRQDPRVNLVNELQNRPTRLACARCSTFAQDDERHEAVNAFHKLSNSTGQLTC